MSDLYLTYPTLALYYYYHIGPFYCGVPLLPFAALLQPCFIHFSLAGWPELNAVDSERDLT